MANPFDSWHRRRRFTPLSLERVIEDLLPRWANGEKFVRAEAWQVEDPDARKDIASPVMGLDRGQVRDWGVPLTDGSRVHIQKFADGHLEFHRDAWDPNQGIDNAVAHAVNETPFGKILAGASALGALGALILILRRL